MLVTIDEIGDDFAAKTSLDRLVGKASILLNRVDYLKSQPTARDITIELTISRSIY